MGMTARNLYNENQIFIKASKGEKMINKRIIPILIILSFFTPTVHATEKILTVGTYQMPPFHMKEEGKITGIYTDMVEAVFKKINVKYAIKFIPLKRADLMLADGDVDAVYDSASWGKEGKIHIPNEILLCTNWGMWIQKKDAHKLKYDTLDDLNGYRVGLILGTPYYEGFRAHVEKKCDVRNVTKNEINLNKLANDRLDFFMYEELAGKGLIKELGINNKLIFLKNAKKNVYYSSHIMFNKENVDIDMVNNFSEALTAFKKSDEFRNLCIKYFGEELSYNYVWGFPGAVF